MAGSTVSALMRKKELKILGIPRLMPRKNVFFWKSVFFISAKENVYRNADPNIQSRKKGFSVIGFHCWNTFIPKSLIPIPTRSSIK